MFYASERHNLAVAQIPKAGLTTIREWLGPDFRVVPNDRAREFSRRVAFFRHPIERLKSCYSFMYWLADYGTPHKSGAPVDSWESFVDYILTHENMHWQPQHEIVGDVPNEYRKFEDLPACYSEYRPGILPHHHRATRLATNDYRGDELQMMYRKDLEIWSAA